MIDLRCGDCYHELPTIADASVDMVCCDLPYGTTNCRWDTRLDLVWLWPQYHRIIKPGAPVVLFANQPFTTDLIMSNRPWFRYCWVWDKVLAGGHLNANIRPLKVTEDIVVFCENAPPFYPQMQRRGAPRWKGGNQGDGDGSDAYGKYGRKRSQNNTYFPTNLLTFSNGDRTREDSGLHPTQKPVSLCSYLILTYTQPGAVVLDNTMGSGTAGVSCVQNDRSFIGIEGDESYFSIAERRIQHAAAQGALPF